jgi:class 3 adenylate cyclase
LSYIRRVTAPRKKSFDAPDERVEVPGVTADVVEMADTTISRSVHQPGAHCPQISHEGKPLCMAHHTGYVVDGALHVEMHDGSVIEVGPNDVFDIPPGHDGWAVGDRPLVAVNWAGFRSWVPERTGERILVTLLFTDIVGSTEHAVALGDTAWRELLTRHYRSVRSVLDRYRGREIDTAGDGFLAVFDGAARAVQAAVAIRDRSARDGLSIRAGVHSGEAEVAGDDLRGVTVHEAARIAAAAGSDEILVSETTRALASGAFAFEARGPFELKGLPGPRTLFAVMAIEQPTPA